MIAIAAMGCGFSGTDGGPGDGEPGDCWGFAPLHIDPCPLELAPAVEIGGEAILDTDEGTLTLDEGEPEAIPLSSVEIDGVEVAVWAVDGLTLSGRLRAEGRRPLLVVAGGNIAISGVVDLTGVAGLPRPAGSEARCGELGGSGGPGQENSDGAGGGGGGGGVTPGAPGQTGDNDGDGTPGGNRGEAAEVGLRGGCSGGSGGRDPGAEADGGTGGAGGGAIHLLARDEVVISGRINAGGGGGGPGVRDTDSAGGGGGGGGYVGLEAPAVQIITGASVAANGGGGGGGADDSKSDATPGASGLDSDAPAPGGSGSNGGGDGGDGAARAVVATTDDGAPDGGGGGGGGGAGAVVIRATDAEPLDGVISPAPLVSSL
jgi:hypothetical protein